ncbi:MAG: tRNA pseudouridine(13) synthase TruD [Planctomycetota bacterium]
MSEENGVIEERFAPPSDPVSGLPYTTDGLEGIGGFIKFTYSDFLVDEIPAYDPCGEGEHCYLLIEKRGLAMSDMLDIVADHFGVKKDAIGYAGMKDKYAITRQVVSVWTPGKQVEQFSELRHDKLSVLWADMHTNKLRVGHLKGNRFSVKIRGVQATKVVQAKAVMDRLAAEGIANYYGPQRFGTRLNNHEVGRAQIAGDYQRALDLLLGPDDRFPRLNTIMGEAYAAGDLERAFESLTPNQRAERTALKALIGGRNAKQAFNRVSVMQQRFFFSAFQSHVFNQVLGERVRSGLLDRISEGDVAMKLGNHACFPVGAEELATEEARTEIDRRVHDFEISPTGPMWGPEMMHAQGGIDELETRALHAMGVTLDEVSAHVKRMKSRLDGTRRAMRVPVKDVEIEGGIDERGHFVRCAFELPPGSFATTVMREIMKDGPQEEPGTVLRSKPVPEDDEARDHDEDDR